MENPLLAALLYLLSFHAHVCTSVNDRPIIGILAQELFNHTGISYIASSYVKFVEGSGARVVPVMINQTDEYYENIVNHVNGILLPGGGTYFNATGGYAEAGAKLYNLAIEKNKGGDHFPVWGTCLGFELLTYAAANETEHRLRCEHYNESSPLESISSMFGSRMFERTPPDLFVALLRENVTANFHYYCVTQQKMKELGLDKDWRFMTVNHDKHGLEYISTLEHKEYPIYGVQFHPEKNNYEWKVDKSHPHTAEAVRVSQYFANIFVNESRYNYHEFPTLEEEKKHLIYNYQPINTSKRSFFMQIYIFNSSSQASI